MCDGCVACGVVSVEQISGSGTIPVILPWPVQSVSRTRLRSRSGLARPSIWVNWPGASAMGVAGEADGQGWTGQEMMTTRARRRPSKRSGCGNQDRYWLRRARPRDTPKPQLTSSDRDFDGALGLWLNDPASKQYAAGLTARGKRGGIIACALADAGSARSWTSRCHDLDLPGGSGTLVQP